MANILGGGSSPNAKTITKYTGLQLQTSAQGVAIPIVYGANVIAPNIIWQNDFQAKAVGGKGGGKGGGGKGASQYTYTEAVILALCEGPINSIGSVWSDGAATTLAALNLSLAIGTETQAPPSWISANYPSQALPYAYTAYLFSSLYQLSGGATLPSSKFEVAGVLYGDIPSFQLPTNGSTATGDNVLFLASTAGVVAGMPVAVSPYIVGGSYVVSVVPNTSVTISSDVTQELPSGTDVIFGYQDVTFAQIIHDYLTNPQYGVVGFPASCIDPVSFAQFQDYCYAQALVGSPALTTQEQGITTLQRWTALCNTWIFWSGNQLKFVPLGDTNLTANGHTYVANTTAVYALTIDDFQFDAKSEAPVTVTRIDPADGYNRVELDVRDRSNAYVDTPVYWEDQATIDQFGLLQSNTVAAPEICNLGVAAVMAALIGQRSVFLRNTYTFKLPWTFLLLETGDIVTITEPNLGLVNYPVRIQTIDEADDMLLKIVAEEFPGTVGSVQYPRPQQVGTGTPPQSQLMDPGDVNPPAIFEPSPLLTGGVPEVWIGLSGGADWGGADIYLSADGVNYAWIGAVNGPTQQGVLTAPLADAADPDLVDTLAVDTSECVSSLSTAVTEANADAFQTASLVDSEIIAYGTVTPTGTFTADLTYLRRGVYGSAPAAHSTGALFSRINPATSFVYGLPQAYVGVTLYLKFTSFNVFGNATQDISSVVEYTYVPVGVAYDIAAPAAASIATQSIRQADGTTLVTIGVGWSPSPGPLLGSYEVQVSADGGATWSIDVTTGAAATGYLLMPALASTYYQARVRAISQNGLAISSWATTAVILSAGIAPLPGVTPTPGAPPPRRAPAEDDEPGPRLRRPAALTGGSAGPVLDNGTSPITDGAGNDILVP